MNEETVTEIVQLAPIALSFIKGAISLVEHFFPPKSGPAKSAAVIAATKNMATATGSEPMLTDEQIQQLIEKELPGVLEQMANPPATVPVATATQMVADATEEHQATISSLQTQLAAAQANPPAPVTSATHGVTFLGSTPTLNRG